MSDQWWPDRHAWPDLDEGEPRRYLPEDALSLLLLDNFIFYREGTGFFVLCSDTFAYACADGEALPFDSDDFDPKRPIWELYDLVRHHGYHGVVVWVMRRRPGARPIGDLGPAIDKLGLV